MSPRHVAILAVLAIPAVAFGSTWEQMPQNVWLGEELLWAENTQTGNLTQSEIEAQFEAPPRAEWCGPEGLQYTPSTAQCDDYDDDLEGWMLDFVGVNDPATLPAYSEPATYCGGC